LNYLSALHQANNDYAQSLQVYRRSMEMQEKILGKEHPTYAMGLNALAVMYESLGEHSRAEALFVETLEIQQRLMGRENEEYAKTLSNLAVTRQSMGKYAEAIPLLREALEIQETLFGKQNSNYATTLSNLASSYDALSRYTEAVQAFQEVVAIEESLHGKQHAGYALSINNLAATYQSIGRYSQAEPLFIEALEIRVKLFGKSDPAVSTSLNNLAMFYESIGDYARAEPLLLDSLRIEEAVWGKNHARYALGLSNLGRLYEVMGRYAESESLFFESLSITEKVDGRHHPNYAITLNNLATLYESMGDYSRSEPLFLQALEIRKSQAGQMHPDYALGLNNLAALYYSMGDYLRAEPLFREAGEIYEQSLGKEHPGYTTSLNNLAALYRSMGAYARAEPLYREALEIRKQLLTTTHPLYAVSLNNLAVLYTVMEEYAQAESMCREALLIREKVLGKEHPEYALSLSNLGAIYFAMGDFVQAEPLINEATRVREKVLGQAHPVYADSLNNLAGVYYAMHEDSVAEPLFRAAVEISLKHLELTADVQSQRQQVAMVESLRHQLDSYLSLATRQPTYQEIAYASLLRWKGSVWQRQQRQRLLIDQPSLKPRFAELGSVSSRLSALILNPPSEPEKTVPWQRQLAELTESRERLERELSLASAEYRQAASAVTVDQLRGSLPAGALLIDFIEYNHLIPADKEQGTKKSVERRLLVHLVRADQAMREIDLGPVQPLNAWVQAWRQDFGQSPTSVAAAQALRQRIWEPLAESLQGVTMVYVSPDGLLGQFPLAALPGKAPGSYLLEEVTIVMLPVPQGLPTIAQSARANGPLPADAERFCLVGGVDYEQVVSGSPTQPSDITAVSDTAVAAVPAVRPLQSRAIGGSEPLQYVALPGTLSEIESIEKLIGQFRPQAKTTILRGPLASKAEFSQLAPQQQYLHIATHGFFARESMEHPLAGSMAANRLLSVMDARATKWVGTHPDLLSGLVFAGANQTVPQSSEANTGDSVLTAAEVQSLDLRSVELAVLSACETGLGATAGGEGIIGLQRAFQLSGAKTTITSLWQVDDAATEALMVEFYRNLFERGLSKIEALRQAQIWLLNHPEAIAGRDMTTRGEERKTKPLDPDGPTGRSGRSLPAFWAAFQLSGDPG
jgi:CHAT domain-containing protein/Flp pilus assembly protein TadD